LVTKLFITYYIIVVKIISCMDMYGRVKLKAFLQLKSSK